ncbi:hypothetical protein GO013_16315 [Pseudodesulfovibrio sp. JC047]|uniref:hypothetical protein n=1 Tax=Pseudodesulfovibrio sp. JC047 TaxID=2683199 RepID=UPI0013D3CC7F|nr:hypothetical protein [Pseudodesulfovibrio sp. JC047]NDV20977.1 hypothetical protein [Pseudodesulfovibrio sp. JC047]
MAIRLMLAKAPVVRAMLNGRQTQDRRLLKPQPVKIPDDADYDWEANIFAWREQGAGPINTHGPFKPAYQLGDIIWVRETYGLYNPGNPETGLPNRDETKIIYPATDKVPEIWFDADDMLYDNCPRPLPMRPSIHMPKWACRLWLKVIDVRIERIRDISEEDAKAEGMYVSTTKPHPVNQFHDLWETLYPGSWERNEWVWVYEFERTERPADWPGN